LIINKYLVKNNWIHVFWTKAKDIVLFAYYKK